MLMPGMRSIDTRSAAPAAKKAAPFYLTPEWRDLIASIIAERGRRCEACSRTGTRIFGDHIRELQDGGAALDRRNIRLLCGACHTAKTAAARAARMRASPAPPPVTPLP
jgi:5-methylcytosine-specific restriction endonuclease McrA